MKTVIVINQEQMGTGDRTLGQKILGTFLRKTGALEGLSAIVFYNGGVKLMTSGSPVLAELKLLHDSGVDLLPCGTCLDHFALLPEIVPASNMDAIVGEIAGADKVITL